MALYLDIYWYIKSIPLYRYLRFMRNFPFGSMQNNFAKFFLLLFAKYEFL